MLPVFLTMALMFGLTVSEDARAKKEATKETCWTDSEDKVEAVYCYGNRFVYDGAEDTPTYELDTRERCEILKDKTACAELEEEE